MDFKRAMEWINTFPSGQKNHVKVSWQLYNEKYLSHFVIDFKFTINIDDILSICVRKL